MKQRPNSTPNSLCGTHFWSSRVSQRFKLIDTSGFVFRNFKWNWTFDLLPECMILKMNLSAFTFFRFNDEIILSNEISNRPSSFWWKIPNRINLKRQMSGIWNNKSDQPMTIFLYYNFVAGRRFAKDDVWKFSISLTWADLDTWSVHDNFDALWGFKVEFVEYKSASF